MFCYQCEQTTRSRRGDGCAHTVGTCGKDAVTADLQDLLIYLVKGVSITRTGRRTWARASAASTCS